MLSHDGHVLAWLGRRDCFVHFVPPINGFCAESVEENRIGRLKNLHLNGCVLVAHVVTSWFWLLHN